MIEGMAERQEAPSKGTESARAAEHQGLSADEERLVAIGKLASKVAHELNNPIDGVLRYINLAMRIVEQADLEKAKEYLTQSRQGLMRMVRIVGELLEFSRSSYRLCEEDARIEHIIDDAVKAMAYRTDSGKIRVFTDYSPDVPEVRPGNLYQVFCNLIKNAVDAMPEGGELYISSRFGADKNIVLEFRDTGIGFAPEDSEAIFEPFFSTKEKGHGTGLGLSICRDIIEMYQGRITAESAAGGGSVFRVYLPVRDKRS